MKQKEKKFSWIKYLIAVLAIFLVAIGIRESTFKVSGVSMAPNLQNGERVFINRFNHHPKRGQVIIFNAIGLDPTSTEVQHAKQQHEKNYFYVKRVIGVPGDTVAQKNGQLYVNGRRVNQSWLHYGNTSYIDQNGNTDYLTGSVQQDDGTAGPVFHTRKSMDDIAMTPKNVTNEDDWTLTSLSKSEHWNKASRFKTRVPAGHYFVLGDHRSDSNDSRYFGFVPADHITGVIKARNHQAAINTAYKHFFAN